MNTPSLLRAVLAACVLTGFTPVRADVVTEWNEIMEQTALATTPEEPLLRARTASITQVAVFEAVNSIVGDYQPYDVGVEAPEAASADAAAIAAAHRVLSKLHPQRTAQLDAAREQSLATIPNGAARADGIAVGIAAADAIIALRATDGVDVPVSYTPGSEPGEYRPTPLGHSPAFHVRNPQRPAVPLRAAARAAFQAIRTRLRRGEARR